MARFEQPQAVDMSGLELLVPLTPADMGGYTAHWGPGTKVTCGTEVATPIECEGVVSEPSVTSVTGECMANMRAAMKQDLCVLGSCINACALSCEAPNSRVGKKWRKYRTTFQRWH